MLYLCSFIIATLWNEQQHSVLATTKAKVRVGFKNEKKASEVVRGRCCGCASLSFSFAVAFDHIFSSSIRYASVKKALLLLLYLNTKLYLIV